MLNHSNLFVEANVKLIEKILNKSIVDSIR